MLTPRNSFSGTANYNNQSGNVTDEIDKANATVVVTGYSITYDGHSHTATVTSITGVNGETGATVGTVDVSGTTHVLATQSPYTDTWNFHGTANYNDTSGQITDVINAKHITGSFTADNKVYDGNNSAAVRTRSLNSTITGDVVSLTGGTATFSDKKVGMGKTVTLTGATLSGIDAGNYVLDSVATTTANITALHITGSFTADNKVYDGNNSAAVLTRSLNGTIMGDDVSLMDGTATFNDKNVGNGKTVTLTGASLSGLDDGNYVLDSVATATANITAATVTASIIGNPSKTYDGNTSAALTSANFSLSGVVSGESFTVTQTIGTYNSKHVATATTVTASLSTADFTPGAGTLATNYALPTTASGAGQITKADAVVVVTSYTSPTTTYDGNPHTATVTSITGVNGETGATVGTVDVSHTTHTNAGTYASDYWFFTGTANYNDIRNTTITDSIGKATATVVVTPYTSLSTTYGAHSHTAVVTSITGVNGETGATVGSVDVSHTTHTDAGTYATDYWFFTGTANYNDIGNTTITDRIGKADAGIVIHDYSGTYDANPHGVTATITGVDAGGTAAGTSFSSDMLTNVPGGTVNWSLVGGTNYKDASGTGHVTIGKATAVIQVTAYTSATTTYDATSHTATGTVTGADAGGTAAGTSLNLSGTTHTNAGTYNNDPWSFSGGTNYYDASGTVNDSIAKATAMITVTKYNVTYDGLPHTATATAKGVDAGGAAVGSSFTLNGTTHANAGTYAGDPWSFSGGTNYNDASGTVDDSIAKAPLTITADNKTIILHAALPTFTVIPMGLVNGETMAVLSGTLTFTPATTPANAGTYDIVPSGLSSNNYAITFQKGTLTVMYSSSCIILGDPSHAILQPINPDGSSVNKAGSTVPAKFRVGDANCNSIGTPGVITSFKLIGQSSDPNATINEDVNSTTPDTAFRWDPTAQQWIFNISTKGMKAGVKYTYQISLNDGSSILFSFALK